MVQGTVRFPTRVYLFYSRFRRGMTLGVRAAVFDRDGRVLLVRHSYVKGWYMPGGGVEPGEAMHEALTRELIEEGGIALTGPAATVLACTGTRTPRRGTMSPSMSAAIGCRRRRRRGTWKSSTAVSSHPTRCRRRPPMPPAAGWPRSPEKPNRRRSGKAGFDRTGGPVLSARPGGRDRCRARSHDDETADARPRRRSPSGSRPPPT